MDIGIVGLGLIGGSLALDLKKRGVAFNVYGLDRSLEHQKQAKELNLVTDCLPLNQLIQKVDLIILAIPVHNAQEMIVDILNDIPERTYLLDMGSTKSGICDKVKDHPKRSYYVACHPMAGTEYTGPNAAVYDLFDQKPVIICDKEESGNLALEAAQQMFQALNMRILYMDSKDHDTHAAYVSHISHISSFTLALSVLDKEQSESAIFDLASGGFESTARLAKSSAEMWSQIFIQNKDSLLEVLDVYSYWLRKFRVAIEDEDVEGLNNLIKEANEIKKFLK
jgi:prephenate dehydrogenase